MILFSLIYFFINISNGVKNYTQTNEWRENNKKFCMKKYGVENYILSDDFKEKRKRTWQKYDGDQLI